MLIYISNLWLYGQAVKTAPSHGAISGSSPDKVTTKKVDTNYVRVYFFVTLSVQERERATYRVAISCGATVLFFVNAFT